MNIDILIDQLIQREGGYVNNPHDSGGETNMGITAAKARAYGYAGDMRALPRSTAATIYKDQYWVTPKFDRLTQIMPTLGAHAFDAGVNMGPQTVSKFIQRALNTMNNQGKDYADMLVDGQLGQMSFYALSTFQAKRGANAEIVLLRLFESQQAIRYMEIAEKTPTQEDFMFGWVLNRVGDIK